MYVFFFSSRRRHTRSLRDWSSDVCSSDLLSADAARGGGTRQRTPWGRAGTRQHWSTSSRRATPPRADRKSVVEGKHIVITTCRLHSKKLIGLKLKRKLKSKLNWIVDFREH